MNFLDTTLGSTHATNVAVKLHLPVDEAARVLAYLDRLQALEAKVGRSGDRPTPDPVKTAAMKARALHAGATKTERLYADIKTAVERYRLQLVNWTGTDTSRAKWLAKQLNAKNGKFDVDGSPSISGWRTVYDYLNTLQF